nr:putative transporter mch2 [Quercus suber]
MPGHRVGHDSTRDKSSSPSPARRPRSGFSLHRWTLNLLDTCCDSPSRSGKILKSTAVMAEKDPTIPEDLDSLATDRQPSDSEKDSGTAPVSSSPPPPPPDGGYGWVCTVCCALINAHTWGLNSSYGVFLAHYLATNTFPGATSLEYAFVGSLSVSCALLVAPGATLTTRIFGTKITLAIGIALETASLIGASFATQIWQLFLSQGVCFGLGMGFLFVGSVGIPPQWFTTKRSLANGIAAAGSGLGGLVYSLAAGAMIQSIGLPNAFRVLGGVSFGVNTVCALLLRDRNKIIGSSQKAFDVSLFKRPEYLLLNAFGFFSMLAYVVLVFSLANYANAIGLNASQASIVSALLNLGQTIGRPPIGYFSDRTGRINMAALMTFLAGLFALVIWTFTASYGVLIFYAILGGTVAGTFWATIGPLSAEVVGLKLIPSALNLEWLILVLPCTFSEPIGLEIVDGTGSYLGAQLFVGFMYMTAAGCLVVLRGWKIGELEELARIKGQSTDEDADPVMEDADERAMVAGRKRMFKDCWRWARV